MTDWIAWTRCFTCSYDAKDLHQRPNDTSGVAMDVSCPSCGNPARLVTFPAFDIEIIDTSLPDRFSYDEMEFW